MSALAWGTPARTGRAYGLDLVSTGYAYPSLVIDNDEFFARASQPLAWWRPSDGAVPILSGRDLTGGGTWMGLNAAGRLALVTNVREPGRQDKPLAPRRACRAMRSAGPQTAKVVRTWHAALRRHCRSKRRCSPAAVLRQSPGTAKIRRLLPAPGNLRVVKHGTRW